MGKNKRDSLVKYLANFEDGQKPLGFVNRFKEMFSLFLFKEGNKIRKWDN